MFWLGTEIDPIREKGNSKIGNQIENSVYLEYCSVYASQTYIGLVGQSVNSKVQQIDSCWFNLTTKKVWILSPPTLNKNIWF